MTNTAKAYDPTQYPPFAVTVDVAVFTMVDHVLHLLLVKRGGEPFAGPRIASCAKRQLSMVRGAIRE